MMHQIIICFSTFLRAFSVYLQHKMHRRVAYSTPALHFMLQINSKSAQKKIASLLPSYNAEFSRNSARAKELNEADDAYVYAAADASIVEL